MFVDGNDMVKHPGARSVARHWLPFVYIWFPRLNSAIPLSIPIQTPPPPPPALPPLPHTQSLGCFKIATKRASSEPSGGWWSYLKAMSGGAVHDVRVVERGGC